MQKHAKTYTQHGAYRGAKIEKQIENSIENATLHVAMRKRHKKNDANTYQTYTQIEPKLELKCRQLEKNVGNETSHVAMRNRFGKDRCKNMPAKIEQQK